VQKKSEIVRKGYTKIAKRYHDQRNKYPSNALLKKFSRILSKGAVLDMGCGAGVPVAEFLVDKRYDVTGIDFAKGMIDLAKKHVPNARFIRMDMTKMKFKPNSFDGCVSFYAIIHVPREKHKGVYKTLHKIIRPGGVLLINTGGHESKGSEDYAENYLNVPMFWSYYGPKQSLKMIKDAGFDILWSKVIKLGGETPFWVLARNRK